MSRMDTYVHTPVITLHYTDVRIPYTCVLCVHAPTHTLAICSCIQPQNYPQGQYMGEIKGA